MTIPEKESLRKKKAILYLVKTGEYSVGYALMKTEELNDKGKLTATDYEELAEWLESLLEEPVEDTEENTTYVDENLTENSVEENIESEEEQQ